MTPVASAAPAAVVAVALKVATGGAAVVMVLGTLFSAQQWSDIQSVVNFGILVYLSYRQQKTRKELPEATAEVLSTNGHADLIAEKVAEQVVTRYLPDRRTRPVPVAIVPPETPPTPPETPPPPPPPTPIH